MARVCGFLTAAATRQAWPLGVLLLAVSTIASAAENAPGLATAAARGQITFVQNPEAQPTMPRVDPAAQTSGRAEASRTSVEAEKSLPEDDYYSKRAKSRLVEDAADAAKQVSLQLAYPGHNVVMCEAGCYGGASRIVHFAPQTTTNSAASSTMQPLAAILPGRATPSDAAVPDEIACVAGCYGKISSYRGASPVAVQVTAPAGVEAFAQGTRDLAGIRAPSQRRQGATGSDASRWMTTSAKADQPERLSAGLLAGHRKHKRRTATVRMQRPRSPPSGEWFQQINADRAPRVR